MMQQLLGTSVFFLALILLHTSCGSGYYHNRFLGAAGTGDVNEVKRLLENRRVEINSSAGGGPAISLAAYYGHVQVVNLLIEHHADVNARDEDGFTPLMHAAMSGQLQVARTLLENRADSTVTVEAYDGKGSMTALDIARMKKHEEVALLIEQFRDAGTAR